ncbi:unnamed protein product [Gadus morhua 'NCC']
MSTQTSSCEPLTQCLGAPSCYTSGRYVPLKQQVSQGSVALCTRSQGDVSALCCWPTLSLDASCSHTRVPQQRVAHPPPTARRSPPEPLGGRAFLHAGGSDGDDAVGEPPSGKSESPWENTGAQMISGGIPHSDGGIPHSDGGSPHSDGGIPHSEGGSPHSEGGTPHSEGGISHSDGGIPHSKGGIPHSEGGSPTLKEGSPTLKEGSPTLMEGSPTLKEGAPTLKEGSPTLMEGSPTLKEGSPTLKEGSPTLMEGSPTLKEGSPTLKEGAPTLNEGSPTLKEGSPTLMEGSPTLKEGSPTLKEGAPTLKEGSSTLRAGEVSRTPGAGRGPVRTPFAGGPPRLPAPSPLVCLGVALCCSMACIPVDVQFDPATALGCSMPNSKALSNHSVIRFQEEMCSRNQEEDSEDSVLPTNLRGRYLSRIFLIPPDHPEPVRVRGGGDKEM